MAALGGKDAVYDDGKRKLDTAILEYDQAISDLTAWVVSSKSTFGIIDLSRPQIQDGSYSECGIFRLAITVVFESRRAVFFTPRAKER